MNIPLTTPGIVNDSKKCENISNSSSRTISSISQQEPTNNNNVMIIDENDHVIRMYIQKFI